ncbi:MAG: TGS domain-containing protein [Candidatus Aenigmarchaeota archaeon]|nr:TGS domain-containing protein [Candidatus Aenigmarchaeota archaeon]
MPINATPEYYKAEEKFRHAKTNEEKIHALEEMIRELPKHKGTENLLAQLRAKLSKLKKQKTSQKGSKKEGIKKEGDGQVCIISMSNIGKSTLLKKLTNTAPLIANYPYTTQNPEVGMMDYKGIKIQIVEIPSTFEPEYVSIAMTADLVVFLYDKEDDLTTVKNLFWDKIRTKKLCIQRNEPVDDIKKKIWAMLGLIIVYTRDRLTKKDEPMALPQGALVKDFAYHIHKDFVKNFYFARLWRKGRKTEERKVGLKYKLKDGDIVEIHTK